MICPMGFLKDLFLKVLETIRKSQHRTFIYIYIYIIKYVYIYTYILYTYCKYIVYLLHIYIYMYIDGIHHWRIFKSSYRKWTWFRFESTTTEFCSEALTDWAIRPWVQLALRANFVQLLQFHLFVHSSRFIHVSFRSLLSSVATFALSEVSHR